MPKDKLTTRLIAKLRANKKPFEVRDTELQGFLLRIEPSGRMSYFAQYRRPDGRRTRFKIGDASILKVEQARHAARKKLLDVAEGRDPQAEKLKARRNVTLEQFIKDEFSPHVAKTKSGAATLRMLRANFGFLMHTKLDAINKADLSRWQNRCAHDGLKAATINRNLAALRACLSYALQLEVLKTHPLAGLKDRKIDSTPRIRFLDEDEERRLFDALGQREMRMRAERDSANVWRRKRGYPEFPGIDKDGFADRLLPMVLVSLHTGIRRGETFSLEWRDLDLDHALLTVRAEVAKSGKERHIPLNSISLDTLTRWKRQSDSENGFVFPSADGGRLDNTKTSWARVMRDANIEGFTWHSMRHDFASRLVMRGVDLNSVRELLGHSDYRTTLKYTHLAPEHKREAVKVLEGASSNVTPFPAQASAAGDAEDKP